ncbi:MAG: hypothetical protein WAN50_03940 [Minisyncoccia bacterium]
MPTQAEVYYSTNGRNNFGSGTSNSGSCPTGTAGTLWNDPTISAAVVSAKTLSNGGYIACNTGPGGSSYAIQAQLNAPSGTVYWCTDSTDRASTSSSPLAGGVVCP